MGLRDLERPIRVPAFPFELGHGIRQACDAVHHDRLVAFEVVGEDDARPLRGQLDHRDPGAHRLDGEDQASPEDIGEIAGIRRDVAAWRVEIVEAFEG